MSNRLTKNFEPSGETRRKQLFTFKYSDDIAKFPQPGLFQTSNSTTVIAWTLIAIIASGVGLILMKKYAGIGSSILYLSILIDVVLAGFSHWNQDKICRLNNEIVTVPENEKGAKVKEQQKFIRIRDIGHFLIWVLAMVQIYFMYKGITALALSFKTQHAAIILLFCISAYLHTKYTGFAWGYLFYKRALNKDIAIHIENECKLNSFDPSKPKRYVLKTGGIIELKECEYGGHSIKKENNEYVLYTNGILEDSDVRKLADGQETDEQKFILAREALKDQLELLKSDAQKK